MRHQSRATHACDGCLDHLLVCAARPGKYYSTIGAGRGACGGCVTPGRRSSRMSPSSVGLGGVPFFVCRSSMSMAISSRRWLRSMSRIFERSLMSSLRTHRKRTQKYVLRQRMHVQDAAQTTRPSGQPRYLGSICALRPTLQKTRHSCNGSVPQRRTKSRLHSHTHSPPSHHISLHVPVHEPTASLHVRYVSLRRRATPPAIRPHTRGAPKRQLVLRPIILLIRLRLAPHASRRLRSCTYSCSRWERPFCA